MAQVHSRYSTQVINVKDAEGVLSVEIRFHNCIVLSHFKVLVEGNLLIEHS